MNHKNIIIGTRRSALALAQATQVFQLIRDKSIEVTMVHIESDGDISLEKPLYELGIQGIFTKALDIALLKNEIDIAVHSMKDIPTTLAKGLCIAAVLKREDWRDVLVHKDKKKYTDEFYTIATGSLRRQAQWKRKFKMHRVENLRGNINTRLKKIIDSNEIDGAIFAAAGLHRIKLQVPACEYLDWMIPAPAQGAIAIVCREEDSIVRDLVNEFTCEDTLICTIIEREFMSELHGGCSTPIGAIAVRNENNISFKGILLSPDGNDCIECSNIYPLSEANIIGKIEATKILQYGGKKILSLFPKTIHG